MGLYETNNLEDDPHLHHSKKKRVGKACDLCRLKKTKCSGNQPCEKCLAENKICIYTERKRVKEKTYSYEYVEMMEKRLSLAKQSLFKMCDLVKEQNPERIRAVTKQLHRRESEEYPYSINDVVRLLFSPDEIEHELGKDGQFLLRINAAEEVASSNNSDVGNSLGVYPDAKRGKSEKMTTLSQQHTAETTRRRSSHRLKKTHTSGSAPATVESRQEHRRHHDRANGALQRLPKQSIATVSTDKPAVPLPAQGTEDITELQQQADGIPQLQGATLGTTDADGLFKLDSFYDDVSEGGSGNGSNFHPQLDHIDENLDPTNPYGDMMGFNSIDMNPFQSSAQFVTAAMDGTLREIQRSRGSASDTADGSISGLSLDSTNSDINGFQDPLADPIASSLPELGIGYSTSPSPENNYTNNNNNNASSTNNTILTNGVGNTTITSTYFNDGVVKPVQTKRAVRRYSSHSKYPSTKHESWMQQAIEGRSDL